MLQRSVRTLVLLVEDNPLDLELAQIALKASDICCEVQVAQDGVEALDVLQQQRVRPTLVLLDLNMPRVNGLEVLRAMQEDMELRQVPVVVFTTSAQPVDLAACLSAGAADYLVKPVDLDDLVVILNRLHRRWLSPVAGVAPANCSVQMGQKSDT
ncbi:response regulator [Deinococcus malanensis]|uniref:Response regulator n=1 Tax=Deinococcus malanensis TaxID=1706855 RepID=A0ABQ2ERU0_9DEIO|nr:response regulator [Deinococcus malanensis]GGK19102.1 response regulator [Deinococcus malanensis]